MCNVTKVSVCVKVLSLLLIVAHWCYTNALEDFRFEVMALAKPSKDFRWVRCSIDLALLKW